ncbi:class I SAM-dependent methyltransferase [Chitinimonas sp. BJYL2]|uniref:class I SAM-dependent methyltransferase n=1 Tax=Chitinimonas sp. BJYL2 TaxID=2976696 RepID=UPI0022B3CAAD|nr:class I SAM-dependent methyltransferase [Chitinimonas sp. BJYL2]
MALLGGVPWGVWVLVQMAVAVGLSLALRQPRWWCLIHALFLPLVIFCLWLALPPWVYLLAFVMTWLVFGRIDRSRVPLYLSNQAALSVLAQRVPEHGRLLDIGAGTATVLMGLRHRRDLILTGIEHAWLPWLLGWLRLRLSGSTARWLRGDMLALDYGEFDMVYAFLSPAAMPWVWEKAVAEMRPNSVLVSNSFPVPGVAADEIIELNDWKGAKLYLWRMR